MLPYLLLPAGSPEGTGPAHLSALVADYTISRIVGFSTTVATASDNEVSTCDRNCGNQRAYHVGR